MEASGFAELTHFHFNGSHREVNLDMMRSRRAYELTRQETNSDARGSMGRKGLSSHQGCSYWHEHCHTHAHMCILVHLMQLWDRLYVMVDNFAS